MCVRSARRAHVGFPRDAHRVPELPACACEEVLEIHVSRALILTRLEQHLELMFDAALGTDVTEDVNIAEFICGSRLSPNS